MVALFICAPVDHVHVYAGGNLTGVETIELEMRGLEKSPTAALANTGFSDFVSHAYIVTTGLLARGLSFGVDEVRSDN
jgi:hypothetical protein